MARPFSHPEVKSLAVGESVTVLHTDANTLVRRVDAYAKRAGRAYDYMLNVNAIPSGDSHCVTRLPDPEPQP